jgi:hypothetical protein
MLRSREPWVMDGARHCSPWPAIGVSASRHSDLAEIGYADLGRFEEARPWMMLMRSIDRSASTRTPEDPAHDNWAQPG